jgi:hypothetical protein
MEEILVDIVNEYITFYRNNGGDFWENIDLNDDTSTNYAMEHFYDSLNIFERNEREGKIELNKVYNVGEMQFEPEIIYGINRNDILFKVSPMLFPLLIEMVNLKQEFEEDKFEIIILKTV